MNSVERIKAICKERKIGLHKLETDLGFGNGYISGLKKGRLPDDRLYAVAKYLNITPDYLVSGEEENKKTATISSDGQERDELKRLLDRLTDREIHDLLDYVRNLILGL